MAKFLSVSLTSSCDFIFFLFAALRSNQRLLQYLQAAVHNRSCTIYISISGINCSLLYLGCGVVLHPLVHRGCDWPRRPGEVWWVLQETDHGQDRVHGRTQVSGQARDSHTWQRPGVWLLLRGEHWFLCGVMGLQIYGKICLFCYSDIFISLFWTYLHEIQVLKASVCLYFILQCWI